MLTETTIAALRALVHLSLARADGPTSPRTIASELGLSPTYFSKIAGMLVKADILRSQRGAHGGVTLLRDPASVTLLQIVEACQGRILGSYCEPTNRLRLVCGYHRAMAELHDGTLEILSRWTLADMASKPCPSPSLADQVRCRMTAPRG